MVEESYARERRVFELCMILSKAEAELREILQSVGKSPREERAAVRLDVMQMGVVVKRKRGRPPKTSLVQVVPVSPDGLPPLKLYRCIDCEKEMQSRQEYLDVVCSGCKGTHVFQVDKTPQHV